MADPIQSNTGTVPPAGQGTTGGNDAFMSSLQDKLFAGAGVVSSQGSNIDNLITSSINDLNGANQSNKQGIQADFQMQKNNAAQQGQNTMTAEMEARRGMATNTGIVQNIADNTNKQLTQLDLAEKSAITKGDMDTASKVAELRVQQLNFQQQATQKAFENQLSIYSTINTAKQTQLAAQKQSFDEQSSMSSIALQFGIKLNPGDTLADVVGRAAPFASQKQQADLALTLANTRKANAEAAKAAAGQDFNLDSTSASAFASTLSNLVASGKTDQANAFLANILDKQGSKGFNMVQQALTKQTESEFTDENIRQSTRDALGKGQSLGTIIDTVNANPFATSAQKSRAAMVATEIAQGQQGSQQQFAGGLIGKLFTQQPYDAKTNPFGKK